VLSLFARLFYYFQQFPRQHHFINSHGLCQFLLILEDTQIKESLKEKPRSTMESKKAKLLFFDY
jgi:hypothetical protein